VHIPLPASQTTLETDNVSSTLTSPSNILLPSSQELCGERISAYLVAQKERNIGFSTPPSHPDSDPDTDTNTISDSSSDFGSPKEETIKGDAGKVCRDDKKYKHGTKEIGIAAAATGLLVVGLAVLEKTYLG